MMPTASAFDISGEKVTDKKTIADSFCNYFTTCVDRLCNVLPVNFVWQNSAGINEVDTRFGFKPVDEREIYNHLIHLKSSKAPGYDNIPPKLLIDAASVLARPLTFIMNLSMKESIFPKSLKIAKVLPLFKSGDRSSFGNYRPISILPCISKIVERVIYNKLSSYLELNVLITSSQFGFRKRYNTELAVNLLTDNIHRAMDRGELTGAVFIDLQKVFDTVEHSILLSKLRIYNDELKWLCNSLSETKTVKFGVPQGSILGPLLFLLHINDLAKCERSATF